MKVARRPEQLDPARRAVAIGTFDGVHLGHRRVIEAAAAAELRTAVVTFDPHPRRFFGNHVEMLATTERRLELLEERGVEDVLLLDFDEALATLEPEAFAESILRAAGAEVVAAGETFRFGQGAPATWTFSGGSDSTSGAFRSSTTSPRVTSARCSRTATCVTPLSCSAVPPRWRGRSCSATSAAERSGSRPRTSRRRPTSSCPHSGSTPARHSVTAPRSRSGRIRTTAARSGGSRRISLDYAGDLYGSRVVVELWERLRDEAVFDSEADLIAAIDDDVARTRAAVRPA